MSAIYSLPVEIILQIFEILTYDPGVLYSTPSWKNRDFSFLDHGKCRRGPSAEVTHHAMVLSQVCTKWRWLTAPLKYRRICVRHGYDVEKALDRLQLHPGAESGVKRLDIIYQPPRENSRTWNDYDIKRLSALVNLCSNLDVFWSRFDRIYPIWDSCYGNILQVVTSSCKPLKWLHWKGHRSSLTNEGWTTTWASLSRLEALEIEVWNSAKGHDGPIIISLPSLKYLRVIGPGIQLDDIIHWKLPSLTALRLSTTIPPHRWIPELVKKHGPSLRLLHLDSHAASSNELDMLAGTSLVELGFWQTVNGPGKPSAPLPSISTVVVRVVDGPGLPIDLVRRTLTGISWVNKSSFAKLQEVVIVGGTFEDMETPYHILALGEDHIFELACRNWDGEGVRVVNRHGVRVWNGDF